MSPTVSIIVPFKERLNLLPQIVETVTAQTFEDWELIVVDDCSTEDMALAMEPFRAEPRISLVSLPKNLGPAAARNAGVKGARGRYVAFIDSDDQWHPEKLEQQLKAIDEVSECSPVVCITLTEVTMPGGWSRIMPKAQPKDGRSFAEFLYCDGGFAQTSSILVSTQAARSNPFLEGLHQYEDHLFLMQLIAAGARLTIVPKVLTIWHNDARPERLSSRDDITMGSTFLRHAEGLLSKEAELAFKVRVLGIEMLRANPLHGTRLISRALVDRAVTPREVVAMAVRKTLPSWTYDYWRRQSETKFRNSHQYELVGFQKAYLQEGMNQPSTRFGSELGHRLVEGAT